MIAVHKNTMFLNLYRTVVMIAVLRSPKKMSYFLAFMIIVVLTKTQFSSIYILGLR